MAGRSGGAGADPQALAAGMLLLATPALLDPNFADTVVLMLDVNDDGALGVVLNRPTDLPVAEVLGPWADVVTEPAVLFAGGPVETQGALAVGLLATSAVSAGPEDPADPASPGEDDDASHPGFRPVAGRLGLLDLDAPVELLAGALADLRIFAGYAGWSRGQLQHEVEEGSWYVLPASDDDVFRDHTARLAALRRDVLRRQPGDLSLHATRPVDPDLN
jgi:putative transcriptional regulator